LREAKKTNSNITLNLLMIIDYNLVYLCINGRNVEECDATNAEKSIDARRKINRTECLN
jgi:hypothetical protein